MQRLLDYFLFGCLWIAFCATLLTFESLLLLRLPTWQPNLLSFVAAATFTHYNLHYWSKARSETVREKWSAQHLWWHLVCMIVGLLVMATTLFRLAYFQWLIIFITGLVTLIYSLPLLPGRRRLKEFGVIKVLTLSLVWTIITVALPAYTCSHEPLFWFMVGRRFLFMMVLCLAFDIRDDALDGVRRIQTLPVRIGRRKTYVLIDVLLGTFIAMTLLLAIFTQRYFLTTMMILSAILTRLAIRCGERFPSERYYLGVVDGMMPMQAALVMLALHCESFLPNLPSN